MRRGTQVQSPARRRELQIQSRRRRIDALVVLAVLAGLLLYGTAFLLLPRTADSVAVTVRQCASVQDAAHLQTSFACLGTTLFQRTFTDAATVSALRAALGGIHELSPLTNVSCNAGSLCLPTRIYSFDLLWHGTVLKSYWASVHRGYRIFWEVTTRGVWVDAALEGPTTWQDVTRLTGMPVEPTIFWDVTTLSLQF
jgi:hypothetical protein